MAIDESNEFYEPFVSQSVLDAVRERILHQYGFMTNSATWENGGVINVPSLPDRFDGEWLEVDAPGNIVEDRDYRFT